MTITNQATLGQQSRDPLQAHVRMLNHFDNDILDYGPIGQTQNLFAYLAYNAFGGAAYQSDGATNYSSSIKKFGGYSLYLDGTTLKSLAHANFYIYPMHKDFTYEVWVYPTSLGSTVCVAGARPNGSTTGFALTISTSGNGWSFWYMNTALWTNSTTGIIPLNTWTNICVTRRGNNWYGFINGVLTNTATNSNVTVNQNQPFLGNDNKSSTNQSSFRGYVDELRFTANFARYTANYAVATSAFPTFVYPPNLTSPTDPYLSNVALLCHFDGANNSTTLTDSSLNAFTLTRTASGTSTKLVNTSSEGGIDRFGNACLQMNAGYTPGSANSGNFSLPASQTPLNMGTGDFTVEFWLARNGQVSNGYIFSCGSTSFELSFTTNNTQLTATMNGTVVCTGVTNILDDTWHAVAVSRQSGTLYVLVDGILEATGSMSNAVDFGGSIWGRRTTSDTTTISCILMDELRITKGIARYTCNYTLQRNTF